MKYLLRSVKFEHEGYSYHRNSVRGDTIYYECYLRRDKSVRCKARLIYKNGSFVLRGLHSNHEKINNDLAVVRAEIENSERFETSRVIKRKIIKKYEHLLHTTNVVALERCISRQRKKRLGDRFKNPTDLNQLAMCLQSDEWQKLFHLKDSSETIFEIDVVKSRRSVDSILFVDKFTTQKLLSINSCRTIYVDGTFATVPRLCEAKNCQLWTILTRHDGRTYAIAYVLMKNRKAKNYVDVLHRLLSIVELQPATIVSDFEKAERKALHTVFPNAKKIGCFFHHTQALVQNLNRLMPGCRNDAECRRGVILLFSTIALFPVHLMNEAFRTIVDVIFKGCADINPFINYYQQTWIENYGYDSFCVYRQFDRTNNVSERHNRELSECLKKRSTVEEFVENLTDHQGQVRNFLSNPRFWRRSSQNNIDASAKKSRMDQLWNEIDKTNVEDIDMLSLLYKMMKYTRVKI